MDITVRRALAADMPVVSEFNRRMALETEGKRLDPEVLAAGVAAILNDPLRGTYYLAEHGGEVVGQLSITLEWSDWRNGWFWWIQSVYVREDARRHGVFRALYDRVYQAARDDPSVIGLRLYVERENLSAQQTYAGLGMEPMSYVMFQRWPL
jgi:GNAT superfamily N-acetyltransferase